MVWSAYMGLPLSLKARAQCWVEKQKLSEGKELIRFFCSPAADRRWRAKETQPA